MSVLDRIAYSLGRRDEVPNQELARELVEKSDLEGVREIARNLWNENQAIQTDCLKVLYEIGYLEPGLIGGFADDFLKLLKHKNNRMVWGGMIALSTIAAIQADELFPHVAELERIIEGGSVITQDNGVKVLAAIASAKDVYRRAIFPYLIGHLETCRPKDVPQHSESILVAVDAGTKDELIKVLEKRMGELSGSQSSRLRKMIRAMEVFYG